LASDLPIVYGLYGGTEMDRICVASTNPTFSSDFSGSLGNYVTQTKDVTPPAFAPPFTLVAK
jgi:hypothetical protein